MKRNLLLVLTLCLVNSLYALSDSIEIVVNRNSFYYTKEPLKPYAEMVGRHDILTITLTNNTNDLYLFWLSEGAIVNISQKGRIFYYFFKVKGDFSLIQVLSDFLYKDQVTIIGYNFIREIKPADKFTLSILIDESTEKSYVEKFYTDRIVVIKKNEVLKYVTILSDTRYDDIYYKFDNLVLEYK